MCMDGYAVAHVDEIGELDDGRAPMRAVRHHFGITSFGVNAWTAREPGARIVNEHDENATEENAEAQASADTEADATAAAADGEAAQSAEVARDSNGTDGSCFPQIMSISALHSFMRSRVLSLVPLPRPRLWMSVA